MNSNRNSTVSGVLSRSNQTELTEPPPLSRSNVPANPVSLPPYRSNIIILFDAMPVFLVIFISQSVQSPLRNINSPFGFHGAVNLSSDSNKRFVYDVGAYNSDDDKADQNGMGVFLNEMAAMMNLCIVRHRSIPILIINILARVSICLLCNLRKPTAVVLLKRVTTEVKTLMGAVLIRRDAEADLNSALRPVEIIGNLASIEKAEKLINEVIAQSEGEGIPVLFVRGAPEQIWIKVRNDGIRETIKNMQTKSRARIQVVLSIYDLK
ncbi:hypothetical protein IGI04_012788 [Brassica rapa subsp. trilocularis]|uniref:Uncharacterized protein n=2 Tax=Brassica TaxID=3705 RepID=A0ABQ7N6X8_BRACM|nr:hypothetical protein IGI04_012788 [Brassica rapa subsp. trilocularis]